METYTLLRTCSTADYDILNEIFAAPLSQGIKFKLNESRGAVYSQTMNSTAPVYTYQVACPEDASIGTRQRSMKSGSNVYKMVGASRSVSCF
mmetsp:Transcript_36321/g.145250  ORF Transcript_36321/g.145250 Transcript_36321/m.145250 type:complete len:92 (-) Transcript_36321:57-332(-)